MMEKIEVSIYIILAGKELISMTPKAEITGSFDYIKVKNKI